MSTQSINLAEPEDRSRMVAALVTAFAGDPFIRWLFPDAEQYLRAFPLVLRYFAGAAFENNSAFRSDDFSGAALWLPPGTSPDEEGLGEVLENHVESAKQEQVFAVMEQVGAGHPEESHWYLPAMGVDPKAQGRGCGTALIRGSLAECDQSCQLAYLESTNPSNVPFYRRAGFDIVGEIQIGGSPVLTRMLRRAD